MEQQQEQKSQLVEYLLKHRNIRTFVFQFVVCIFFPFMCINVGFLPPFEDHPHDLNIFRFIYYALIVYSVICFSGPISGSHINPAITLAIYASKKLQKGDGKLILSYISAQLSGCMLGCVLSKVIIDRGGPIYSVFPDTLELLKNCTQEMIATFLLVIFIFIISNEETTFVYSEAWRHLLVGLIFYFCLTFSTHIHLLNPALVFSFQGSGMIFSNIQNSTIIACLCLMVAQLFGGWLAQFIFTHLYLKQTRFWKNQFK